MKASTPERLPQHLRSLFWDTDPRHLRWPTHRDQITARILASGPWESVRWLRSRLSDEELRSWILERKGRGLSPQQLRFWQLILGIPARKVNAWLRSPERRVWDDRFA